MKYILFLLSFALLGIFAQNFREQFYNSLERKNFNVDDTTNHRSHQNLNGQKFEQERCNLCRYVTDELNQRLLSTLFLQAYTLLLGGDQLNAEYSFTSLKELIATPDFMCVKLLKMCDDIGEYYVEIDPYEDAVNQIISDKPTFLKDNNFID